MQFDLAKFISDFLPVFGGAVAAYLAIRGDIADLKATARAHGEAIKEVREDIGTAHARIDKVLQRD